MYRIKLTELLLEAFDADVKKIQQLLKRINPNIDLGTSGDNHDGVDGDYGTRTKNAILTVISDIHQDVLNSGGAPKSNNSEINTESKSSRIKLKNLISDNYIKTSLKEAVDDVVIQIQRMLKVIDPNIDLGTGGDGDDAGTGIDGEWGNKTKKAIIKVLEKQVGTSDVTSYDTVNRTGGNNAAQSTSDNSGTRQSLDWLRNVFISQIFREKLDANLQLPSDWDYEKTEYPDGSRERENYDSKIAEVNENMSLVENWSQAEIDYITKKLGGKERWRNVFPFDDSDPVSEIGIMPDGKTKLKFAYKRGVVFFSATDVYTTTGIHFRTETGRGADEPVQIIEVDKSAPGYQANAKETRLTTKQQQNVAGPATTTLSDIGVTPAEQQDLITTRKEFRRQRRIAMQKLRSRTNFKVGRIDKKIARQQQKLDKLNTRRTQALNKPR